MAVALPWWLRLSAKLFLSRLPISYGVWRRLGLFRHGQMDDPQSALHAFEYHFSAMKNAGVRADGFSLLEIGVGDSLLSGFAAYAFGAHKVWLVDADKFARTDLAAVQDLSDCLAAREGPYRKIEVGEIFETTLAAANITYLTNGTASLRELNDGSVDYCFSQVVLEHIVQDEFMLMMRELRRVMAPNGVAFHTVDFRDHLGGGLNNLRFPRAIWENPIVRKSGFYTNRIRPQDMIEMIRSCEFEVEVIRETRWPERPIKRRQLASEFAGLDEDALLIAEFEILMRPC